MNPLGASDPLTRVVVGIAELKISADPRAVLVTYALGSCVAVMVHDPVKKVAGLIHYMLPLSKAMPQRGIERPGMFADTGVPALFHRLYGAGCAKTTLVVKVAGGGQLLGSSPEFDIGRRNVEVLERLFARSGVRVAACDIGGVASRTVEVSVATGEVVVRSRGKERRL